MDEIKDDGLVLDRFNQQDMQSMTTEGSFLAASFPVDSATTNFWEQQMKYNKTHKKLMKWD